MSDQLVSLSLAQGGRGVSLKNQAPVTQLNAPSSLGTSPGPGTGCSIILNTGSDTAYDNAVISWFVKQNGRLALFTTTVIDPADNAAQGALSYSVGPFAADYWEATITLTGATLPAAPLLSSLTAFGVEDIPPGPNNPLAPAGAVVVVTSKTGPSIAGAATFPIPANRVTLYQITLIMRILSSAVDPVGDAFVTTGPYPFNAILANATPVDGASFPSTFADALMTTAVASTPAVAGGLISIAYVTPTGLDVSTVTQITVTLAPLAYG
jgi:hypothetical protein